jgi:hypothetical protein
MSITAFNIDTPAQLRICISRALSSSDMEIYVKALAKFKWQHCYIEPEYKWSSETGEEVIRIFREIEELYPYLNHRIENVIDNELDMVMLMEEINPHVTRKLFQ